MIMDSRTKKKKVISDFLIEIGAPISHKGFEYLVHAIMICYDRGVLCSFKHDIYPAVAEEFSVKPSLVERYISGVILEVWRPDNLGVLRKFFAHTIPYGRLPTNSEFISLIADTLMVEERIASDQTDV